LARKPADQSVSRQAILYAAADVLQRGGYDATTMKDIAAEVNLTAASLYHHFKNKDELLLAVLEAGLDVVIDRLDPIVKAEMPCVERLRAMISVHIVTQTENTAVAAAMVFEIRSLLSERPAARVAGYHERRQQFFARRDRFEDLYRSVVAEGIEKGVFRPVDVPIFVKAMLGAHNWVSVWYRSSGRLSGQEIADRMADTFLRALLIEGRAG
jgi:AcrR family transcriptional regulator